MRRYLLTVLSLFLLASVGGESFHESRIPVSQDEHWWGGAVALGSRMPYVRPLEEFDLALEHRNNQVVPLLLSDKGRYLWSEKPFRFQVVDGEVIVRSRYERIVVRQAGNTLREAYSAVSREFFPPSGTLPDPLFFTMPQYNTWIELMYDQNQRDIIKYAHGIISNGLPPGVLMIDDNWQKRYGNFEFRADRFPDPRGMVDSLHSMGFRVMVWVSPFVSADSEEYRFLESKGWLLTERGSKRTAIIRWWNGQSACYDLTNPEAFEYLTSQLERMQVDYGIDGFKFDAGDNSFYDPALVEGYDPDALSVDHTSAWVRMGLQFPFNEYRAGWRMGGQPLVQRLGDKDYSWDALRLLIPEMTAAGLMGYAYACPDMIGGGSFGAFMNIGEDEFDQRLIVRSAQVHALMPMMQFSLAPWRVLGERNMQIVREAARLHERFGPYILRCAEESSRTGEPIVRCMEYCFPGRGFALCRDQFMLGERYMVAPVVTPENSRTILLPEGRWRDHTGKIHRGGRSITMEVPLDTLPWFERLDI